MKVWTRGGVVDSRDGTVDDEHILLNKLDERFYDREEEWRRVHNYPLLYRGYTTTPRSVIVVLDRRSPLRGGCRG